MDKIQEAMEALNKHTETMRQSKIEELRGGPGPRGPEGPAGRDGRDGKDAPALKITIGTVRSDDAAAAAITDLGNGEFTLHLVLPRGKHGLKGDRGEGPEGPQGPKGEPGLSIRGPKGDPGRDGVDGKNGKDGATGPVGPQGVQGERGEAGLDENDIRQIVTATILEVLQNAGVMTEQAKRLVQVRAKLKSKIQQASNRSIAEIVELVKDVDRVFEE